MKPIRALIVDDEPLAREGIRQQLMRFPRIGIAGEAEDGPHAVEAIRTLAPDLVFLDIQMPAMDGFGVVREIGPAHMPAVVFVTAFDEFALQAFAIHALDYLLKPIDPERFDEAVNHALAHLEARDAAGISRKLLQLLEDVAPKQFARRLPIKSSGRVTFVDTRDIDWIQANGDYVWIHTNGKKSLMREKIGELQHKLDPDSFSRIHRSTIVNVGRITHLEPTFSGDYSVHLQDGTKLTLSRSFREELFARLHLT